MHRCKAQKVDFRSENPQAMDTLLQILKEKMPKKEEVKKEHLEEYDKMQAEKNKTANKKKVQQHSNISYQVS